MSTIKTTMHRFPDISRLEIETIIAHALKKPREFVLISPEYELNTRQLTAIEKLVYRRQAGEPLAYLTGNKEFYGLNFLVNRHVLVPRPETELMIDEVMALAKQGPVSTIIDIGTGSGCIAISLAKHLPLNCHSRVGGNPVYDAITLDSRLRGNDRMKIFAIDISKRALAVAKKNARLNGVDDQTEFIHGNLLAPLLKKCYTLHATRYVICANLPYLTPKQIALSPSIQKEPRLALESGPDGLRHYRQLFRQIKNLDLKNCTILCEIDDTQGAAMSELIKKELPRAEYEIKKDLGSYDRLAIIHVTNSKVTG